MSTRKTTIHLKISEVAKRLGHSTRWVRYQIEAGHLEAFKWSANDVTVSEESVLRFEDQARVTSGPRLAVVQPQQEAMA